MNHTSTLLSFGLCALVLVSMRDSICQAHCGSRPPPPDLPPFSPSAPPLVPAPREVIEIHPPRWSWIHWWEANRDPYVRPALQSSGDPTPRKRISEKERKQALKALIAALQKAGPQQEEHGKRRKASDAQAAAAESTNARIRAAALMALGRIGGNESLDTLSEAARSDPDPSVRRTAVLALGLLGTPEAAKVLVEDRDIRNGTLDVRTAALGLVSDLGPRSTARLQSTLAENDANLGSIAAWGLKRTFSPRTAGLFRKVLANSTSSWLASEAILSMGYAEQPDFIPFLTQILLEGPGAADVAAYRALVAARGRTLEEYGAQLRTFRQSEQAVKDHARSMEEWKQRYDAWKKKYPNDWQSRLSKYHAEPLETTRRGEGPNAPPLAQPQAAVQQPLSSGLEWTYASELRGSAAMALGMIDSPQSRLALLRALDLPDDYYSELYKGPTLISLGRIGDRQCLQALLAVLSPIGLNQKLYDSALRGYAAIGLGLYARPISPNEDRQAIDQPPHQAKSKPSAKRPADIDKGRPQTTRPAHETTNRPQATRPAIEGRGTARLIPRAQEEENPRTDRPEFRRAIAALSQCLFNPKETLETRTACVAALGICQRQEALPTLRTLANMIRPGEETLLGYSLLARGMLRDSTIIEPARKLLAVTSKRTDMSAVLAQRAAILGLGLLDNLDTIPLLKETWDLNYYASREVILALSFSRSTDAGDILLDLLEKSENPLERAYISRCIGEFYAENQPSPLTRFINDTNYMMRNDNLRPYQSMANEFLFDYLTAAFGGEWR